MYMNNYNARQTENIYLENEGEKERALTGLEKCYRDGEGRFKQGVKGAEGLWQAEMRVARKAF